MRSRVSAAVGRGSRSHPPAVSDTCADCLLVFRIGGPRAPLSTPAVVPPPWRRLFSGRPTAVAVSTHIGAGPPHGAAPAPAFCPGGGVGGRDEKANHTFYSGLGARACRPRTRASLPSRSVAVPTHYRRANFPPARSRWRCAPSRTKVIAVGQECTSGRGRAGGIGSAMKEVSAGPGPATRADRCRRLDAHRYGPASPG